MANNNDTIKNPKPPSERDLQVLKWMDDGNRIDQAKALNLFKTTSLRDIIYRLRCAGYEIKHEDVSYETKEGERKSYRQWFTTDSKIIASGQKVEKVLKGKTVSDYAGNIASLAKNLPVVQASIFDSVS